MKKSIKQFCSLFLAAAMVTTLVVQPKEAEAKKKYSLAKNKITLQEGATKKLTCKGVKKSHKLIWKSDKKFVATVSQKGKVKAKKIGKAKITVTIKNKKNKKLGKLTCTVTVKKNLQNTSIPSPTMVPSQNPQPIVTQNVQASTSPAITDLPTETPVPTEEATPIPTPLGIPYVLEAYSPQFPCQVRDAKDPEKIIQIEGIGGCFENTDSEEGIGRIQICASSLEETEEVETGYIAMDLIETLFTGKIVKEFLFEVTLDGNPNSNVFEIDVAGLHLRHQFVFPDVIAGTQGKFRTCMDEEENQVGGIDLGNMAPVEVFYEYHEKTGEILLGYDIIATRTYLNFETAATVQLISGEDVIFEWQAPRTAKIQQRDYCLYRREDGSMHYGIPLLIEAGTIPEEVLEEELTLEIEIGAMNYCYYGKPYTLSLVDGKTDASIVLSKD